MLNIVWRAQCGCRQKVPVALVGTTMPGGMVIKKAKLRGVPSFGMICSERELGLSEDHNGIMVLPEGFKVGTRLIDALDLDTEILKSASLRTAATACPYWALPAKRHWRSSCL